MALRVITSVVWANLAIHFTSVIAKAEFPYFPCKVVVLK